MIDHMIWSIIDKNHNKSFPDVLFWPAGCTLKAFFAKENNMQFMNQQVLANCTDLRHLFLSQNEIAKVPPKLLEVIFRFLFYIYNDGTNKVSL